MKENEKKEYFGPKATVVRFVSIVTCSGTGGNTEYETIDNDPPPTLGKTQ